MISKELLEQVMNLNRIDDIYVEDNLLYFCELNCGINIYELSYKCKEWIVSKDLSYTVYYDDSFKNYKCDILEENCNDGIPSIGNIFVGNTEIEAIFKACEWILKEINAKPNK